MKLFLFFYLLLYGSIHVHFYWRMQAAFPSSTALRVLAALFLLFMVLSPILIRASEQYGYEETACVLSYAGYLWMGLIFLFFAASLALDLWRLLVWMADAMGVHSASILAPSVRMIFLVPLIVSLGINAYGYFEAQHIVTERVVIVSPKIPPGAGRIRIVQISDVHIGMIVQGKRLERIADAVREARPDILVSTGDLVDGQIDSIGRAAGLLSAIPARLGKYAVTGNHEFYAGLDQALRFTRDSGFTVLRGESAVAAGLIRFVGVDDPTGRQMGLPTGASEKNLFAEGGSSGLFTILLKHQPAVRDTSTATFDLQLSGHTHRGQIFPFSAITKLYFPYHSGTYNLPNGSIIHISRGTGTWGPPVRFLSPPEVTVIELVGADRPR